MSKVAQQRLRERFDLFDLDRNDYLESGDFDALIQRLLAAFQLPSNAPKARKLQSAIQRYWQGLRDSLDRDDDSRVSFEEYTSIVHDETWFDTHLHDYAGAIAALGDVDDDGYVERADLIKSLAAVGFKTGNAEDTYRAMDTDNDGRVSTAEWIAVIRDYYVSHQANTTASRLIGAATA